MPDPIVVDPTIRPIAHFNLCREALAPAERLKQVQRAAVNFRETLLGGGTITYFRSFDLIRVPYPTRFALREACTVPTPFVHILNRMFIVQYRTDAGIKTMLVSPSDVQGNRATPFFHRLSASFGPAQRPLETLMAPILSTVEDALRLAGITPEQVDYLTYDHLHTQDLRRWLGTDGAPGYFPNAKLLVMQQEWESVQALLPPQRDWYCPAGTAGLAPERIVLLDADVMLGEGVALVRTPGHTEGNHSIVVHTPDGVFVSSENGVGADAYAPLHSRIPGVRRYAQETGMEVVLNGNTMEGGLDQYLSMVLEKTLAGPCPRNPDFYNVMPTSELSEYWLFPGIKPTFAFGEVAYGAPQRSAAVLG